MPKLAAPLTDLQIKRAKPADKLFKLSDGAGLYLEVLPTGAKFWRFRFRQASGKENLMTFGPYPEVSLSPTLSCAVPRRCFLAGANPVR